MKKLSAIIMLLLLSVTAGGLTLQASEDTSGLVNRRINHAQDCIYDEDEVTCPHFFGRHANCLENGVYVHRNCDLATPDAETVTDNVATPQASFSKTKQQNTIATDAKNPDFGHMNGQGHMNNTTHMNGEGHMRGNGHMRSNRDDDTNGNSSSVGQRTNMRRGNCH